MDALHFDLLGKRLAAAASRRTLVRGIVPAAVAAAGLASFDLTAEAKNKNDCLRRCRKHRSNNNNCRKRCRRRFKK